MRLLDTLSGEKREIPKKNRINLFVCGPTVYDHAHIGHARTYLAFDILVRYLRNKGIKTYYLQNITDIDDKIIDRAYAEKKSALKLATGFYYEYLKDLRSLNINSVTKYARATKFIPEIVRQVQKLIKKGVAYAIPEDGIYFDISKFPDYGKLARRTSSQADDGVSRIDDSVAKRNKGDFCLWKFSKKIKKSNEPSWDTNIGRGRPGWHIEDTAISEHYFGPQYDIHGGAEDLKFPHHEAEIAQQEAASGLKPFVKIWLHAGFLLVDGKKMSKSLKNFITIKDFIKNNSPDILRWIVFSQHYRSPIYYNQELLGQAKKSYGNITGFLNKLEFVGKKIPKKKASPLNIAEITKATESKIESSLSDDFKTPEAVAALFEMVNKIEPYIWEISRKDAKNLKKYIGRKLNIFGFSPKIPKIPLKIRLLVLKRELSRRNKQFVKSDALRKELNRLGYSLEDTPLGPWLNQI